MGEQGRSRAKAPPTHWRGSHGNLGGWSLWVVVPVLLLRFRVNIEFRRHFKRQATILWPKNRVRWSQQLSPVPSSVNYDAGT